MNVYLQQRIVPKNLYLYPITLDFQINSDPEKFIKSNVFLEDGSDMDNEGMAEFEQNIADLETMLAASKSASSKRSSSKKYKKKHLKFSTVIH